MDPTNLSEFVDLLTRCLKVGWDYVGNPPTEQQWHVIVRRGRAMHLLENTRPCVGGRVFERAHLIRGQRSNCLLHYERECARVGMWSAWVTTHFKPNDYYASESALNLHHPRDLRQRSMPPIAYYQHLIEEF